MRLSRRFDSVADGLTHAESALADLALCLKDAS
jgi:hypothetical protein